MSPESKSVSQTQSGPRRLPILLRRAWYGLNQAFRRRIAHTQCTPDQYTVLRNLAECRPEGLTQTELTRCMSSDPNTMTSLVTRMARLGLVERRRDPADGRVRRVSLKPLGQRRYEELRCIAQELQEEALSVLPVSQRTLFLGGLEAVARQCRSLADLDPD